MQLSNFHTKDSTASVLLSEQHLLRDVATAGTTVKRRGNITKTNLSLSGMLSPINDSLPKMFTSKNSSYAQQPIIKELRMSLTKQRKRLIIRSPDERKALQSSNAKTRKELELITPRG